MSSVRLNVVLATAMLSVFFLPCRAGAEVSQALINERAHFLAGMPLSEGSPLKKLEALPDWHGHQDELELRWNRAQASRFKAMSEWSAAELRPKIDESLPLLYLFGGPDFVTANMLYPKAPRYILGGLELVGSLPAVEEMPKQKVSLILRDMRSALRTALRLNFFVTGEMTTDLHRSEFRGVLPLFCAFLARTKGEIKEIRYLEINAAGEVQEVPAEMVGKGIIPGVKIVFLAQGESQPQELYYFRADASDKALSADHRFLVYLQSLGKVNSFLKAASYLMHTKEFNVVRDTLLAQSVTLLQDDSGIPFRFFQNSGWKYSLYGNYRKPISDFAWAYQDDFKKQFAVKELVKPLPYAIGYGHPGDMHLLFATKAASETPHPETPSPTPAAQ